MLNIYAILIKLEIHVRCACVCARALDHCCCFIHCTDGTFVMVLRIQCCAIAVGQTLILLSSSHVVAEERNLGIQIRNMFLEPKVLTRRRNLKMDTRSYTCLYRSAYMTETS